MKPEAIFISVCRSAMSVGPERASTGPSVLHFVYTSSISLFPHILDHNFSRSLPSPTPGRQLETVEGSPLVARLHWDEDPTRGGLVQQEEAVVNGRTPSEIIKQPPLHPEIITFWGLGLQFGCNWKHFSFFFLGRGEGGYIYPPYKTRTALKLRDVSIVQTHSTIWNCILTEYLDVRGSKEQRGIISKHQLDCFIGCHLCHHTTLNVTGFICLEAIIQGTCPGNSWWVHLKSRNSQTVNVSYLIEVCILIPFCYCSISMPT